MDPQPRRQRASILGATRRDSVPDSHIFLCREIAQAANHVGMEKGSKFHSGLRKLLISSLVSCRRRCATCELCFNE